MHRQRGERDEVPWGSPERRRLRRLSEKEYRDRYLRDVARGVNFCVNISQGSIRLAPLKKQADRFVDALEDLFIPRAITRRGA